MGMHLFVSKPCRLEGPLQMQHFFLVHNIPFLFQVLPSVCVWWYGGRPIKGFVKVIELQRLILPATVLG